MMKTATVIKNIPELISQQQRVKAGTSKISRKDVECEVVLFGYRVDGDKSTVNSGGDESRDNSE
jgi:hypothetical protein